MALKCTNNLAKLVQALDVQSNIVASFFGPPCTLQSSDTQCTVLHPCLSYRYYCLCPILVILKKNWFVDEPVLLHNNYAIDSITVMYHCVVAQIRMATLN